MTVSTIRAGKIKRSGSQIVKAVALSAQYRSELLGGISAMKWRGFGTVLRVIGTADSKPFQQKAKLLFLAIDMATV